MHSIKENRQLRRANAIRFIRTFIKNPLAVGAILPSSPELARAMVKDIQLSIGESLMELGPGTGPLTREIQHLVHCPRSYIGIEREPAFVSMLDREFPDLTFVSGDAAFAHELHKKSNMHPIKAVISGLPFASLSNEVRNQIINSLDVLLPAGSIFRTFQYVHAYPLLPAVRFRKQMSSVMQSEPRRSEVVFKNIPPAYVLTWTR